MKVCGIQFDLAWEDPDANFARVRQLARRAADEGARLIVLPEMFATGFSMNARAVARHSEATLSFLRQLARELRIAVLAGLAEPGKERPANAAWALDPDGGTLAHYRKLHPFSLAGEDEHFEAGDALAVFEWDGLRIAPFICYDLRFPEPFRAAASATDLFVVIANWPARRGHAWRSLLVARAIENQAYVLGVNRVGIAEGQPHSGDSALIDPFGEILAGQDLADSEALIGGDADPFIVSSARERFGFLLDRRPALYRRLQLPDNPRGD